MATTCAWLVAAVVLAVVGLNAGRAGALTSDSLHVRLADDSPILGRYLTSHGGRGIRAFMGVPYAQAPLNELRFRVRNLGVFGVVEFIKPAAVSFAISIRNCDSLESCVRV